MHDGLTVEAGGSRVRNDGLKDWTNQTQHRRGMWTWADQKGKVGNLEGVDITHPVSDREACP